MDIRDIREILGLTQAQVADELGVSAWYELFDISGILVLKNELFDAETEVDIGKMPAGVYLLKIINGDDVMSKMILKY